MTLPAARSHPPVPDGDATPATIEAEFAAAYRTHFSFAWRTARRLGCTAEEAEDVVQESFLIVHRRWHDYDASRSLRGWLFGIVWRVARTRARSRARERNRLRLVPDPPPPPSPEDAVRADRAAQLVREFLATVDDRLRVVFVLSELEGFTGTEIAQALGVNRNTVYTRARTARKRFERFVLARNGSTS